MWCKLFYWMRLFKATAAFITLIFQTLSDVKIFAAMLAIILVAFANFFFVINNNTTQDDYHYVGDYVGHSVVDAFIAMYLMGLGEFDMDGYSQGPNVWAAWIMFTLGTALVLVVFMNMLIAIMGDTFGRVLELQEENALQEQASLISDHIFLMDLKEEFKGMRHIIVLTPDLSVTRQEADLSQELALVGHTLSKRTDASKDLVVKRIEAFEKNQRSMLKGQ
jgi:hypothetical protein